MKFLPKNGRTRIDPVLFGLTTKTMNCYPQNFAQIEQNSQETNTLLEEYKKYYEDYESSSEQVQEESK